MNEFYLKCIIKKNIFIIKSILINKTCYYNVNVAFIVSETKRKRSMFSHTFENMSKSKMLLRTLTDEDMKPEDIRNQIIAEDLTLILNRIYKMTQHYFEKNGMLIIDEEEEF